MDTPCVEALRWPRHRPALWGLANTAPSLLSVLAAGSQRTANLSPGHPRLARVVDDEVKLHLCAERKVACGSKPVARMWRVEQIRHIRKQHLNVPSNWSSFLSHECQSTVDKRRLSTRA